MFVDDERAVRTHDDREARVRKSEVFASAGAAAKRDEAAATSSEGDAWRLPTGSSISKNSFGPKLNMPATMLVGTVSRAFSYVSTVSL